MADKLMRTLVVVSFFLGLALFSGCGTNGAQLTQANNGEQISVQAGDTLTLTLESNPTTGFSWQVMEIDQAVLIQDGDPQYEQSPGTEGMAGAGGTETFRFRAVSSGQTSLGLGYMRPWESVQPVETFTVRIVVE